MNKSRYFQVVNSGTPNVGEIKIYGLISDWYDDVNAIDFLAAFNALETMCTRINIHINSPGGSVWEGLPIVNAIKASKVDVHTYVDGIAFSMAGIIAISAKHGNVHMAKGSLLMLHSASMFGYGNAEQLKKVAEDLEKYDSVLAGYVEDRTGKSLEEVKAQYFDGKDHFFTSAEALEEGLIDHVENYDSDETPDNVRNMSMLEVSAWFDSNTLNSNNQKEMFNNKFSKLSALAKVAVSDRTDANFEEVNNQIQEAGIEGVKVVSDIFIQDQETKVSDLESQIMTKDNRISELEQEVKNLGNKPADTPGTPGSDGDNIPSGDGSEKKEEETIAPAETWARNVLALQG